MTGELGAGALTLTVGGGLTGGGNDFGPFIGDSFLPLPCSRIGELEMAGARC